MSNWKEADWMVATKWDLRCAKCKHDLGAHTFAYDGDYNDGSCRDCDCPRWFPAAPDDGDWNEARARSDAEFHSFHEMWYRRIAEDYAAGGNIDEYYERLRNGEQPHEPGDGLVAGKSKPAVPHCSFCDATPYRTLNGYSAPGPDGYGVSIMETGGGTPRIQLIHGPGGVTICEVCVATAQYVLGVSRGDLEPY